ncbi:MAG: hypothetical protein HY781_07285 [Chloroflexi bacterium]|nr:hypothetical protein [Chloroflexota bacterium]
MMSYKTNVTGVPRQIYIIALIFLITALACETTATPAPESPTATSTPKIGVPVYGVTCNPAILEIPHGFTKSIHIVDTGEVGKVTEFKVGTVAGTASDPDASEIAVFQPDPNETGWSKLPGAISVGSLAVDGPTRTETYFINIIVGGAQGDDNITGGNIWCQVNVKHEEPTPTFTITPTITATPTQTATSTKPPFIVTGSGNRVQYTGPWQAQTGGTLAVSFQVMGPDNHPAQSEWHDHPHAGCQLAAGSDKTVFQL